MCVSNGKLTLNSGLDYGISHCVLVLFLSVRPQKIFFIAGKATYYVQNAFVEAYRIFM